MPLNSNARLGDGSIYGEDAAGPVDGDFVAVKRPTLFRSLLTLGLTTNLKLCLDDATYPAQFPSGTSFPPANQMGSNEAWPGRQTFRPASQPAWADTLHKDSAQFSIAAWLYVGTTASHGILGDNANAAVNGFQVYLQAARRPQIFVGNGGSTVLSVTADTAANLTAWNFVGITIDETSPTGGFFYMNGAYNQVGASDTFDPTYSSPAAGAAAQIIEAWANGNTALFVPAGSRGVAIATIQGSVWSKANFDSIWAATRTRFGL